MNFCNTLYYFFEVYAIKKHIAACAMCLLSFGMVVSPSLQAQAITVLTETFPPFSYEEDGRITGLATQRVEALLREAQVDYEIEVGSWSRVLRRARNGQNILLYSVGRTPAREADFFWIGPLMPFEIGVFALEDSTVRASTIHDLRRYRIGVVRGDVRDQLLSELGGFELVRFRNSERLLRALERGNVDLVPLATLTVPVLLDRIGLPPNTVRLVVTPPELQQADLYLVTGRESDTGLVNRLQGAWEQVEGQF